MRSEKTKRCQSKILHSLFRYGMGRPSYERVALPEESVLFAEAKNNDQPSDGLMLVYLVELDGGETDEQPVDPGAFPPART